MASLETAVDVAGRHGIGNVAWCDVCRDTQPATLRVVRANVDGITIKIEERSDGTCWCYVSSNTSTLSSGVLIPGTLEDATSLVGPSLLPDARLLVAALEKVEASCNIREE